MPETIFSYNEKQSFGLVNCDPTRQPPIATYQVVNIEGQVVGTLELSLDNSGFTLIILDRIVVPTAGSDSWTKRDETVADLTLIAPNIRKLLNRNFGQTTLKR